MTAQTLPHRHRRPHFRKGMLGWQVAPSCDSSKHSSVRQREISVWMRSFVRTQSLQPWWSVWEEMSKRKRPHGSHATSLLASRGRLRKQGEDYTLASPSRQGQEEAEIQSWAQAISNVPSSPVRTVIRPQDGEDFSF